MNLTIDELKVIRQLLLEEAERMDDDGNEGAFNESPLAPILRKITAELRK